MDADEDAVMIACLLKNAGIEYRFRVYGKLDEKNRPEFETVKVEARSKSGNWVEFESAATALLWMRENLG